MTTEKTSIAVNEFPASAVLTERGARVLKHDESFGIFDSYGDISHQNQDEQGLYHAGTRYLSQCELKIGGEKPILLGSFITEDNRTLTVDLTNPCLEDRAIPYGAIHILRTIFLWNQCRYELISFYSYLSHPIHLDIMLELGSDYRDIFEVRGHTRKKRGSPLDPHLGKDTLGFSYLGLDGIERHTWITSAPSPLRIWPGGIEHHLEIPSRGAKGLEFIYQMSETSCTPASPPKAAPFAKGFQQAKTEASERRQHDAVLTTSNEQFNDLINRSMADIHLLITTTEWGPYPYAGVPWFSAPFGRDGIITAMEMLWLNPDLAQTVLHFLAEHQGQVYEPENDCEPGKILHELRQGEMANLGEIPFRKYYGSVDATPLFVLLAGAYLKRTADIDFIQGIWPQIQQALQWMEQIGDSDGDGFIEYCRHSTKGLVHQGWKDSDNSIFHASGQLAEAPIALAEVQGYFYLALKRAAYLAHEMGDDKLANRLSHRRYQLKDKFQQSFWQEELGFYALALDQKKSPCKVKSSNIGHCLYTGIIPESYAARVTDVLMSPLMFSGFGIRTIAEDEALYNPMSYHNGTVWPHDCAIAGAGMARYGFKDQCIQILTGLFDASNLLDFHRLPELFCGFSRALGKNPTIYPGACAPQAWSTASILFLLGACLGIKIRAAKDEVLFYRPRLPAYIESATIRNLTIRKGLKLDLNFVNHGDDVGVNILKREGPARVVVIK